MALSIEDERQITAVINNYSKGIDTRDYELFRSCFADVIEADYGAPDGSIWRSGAAITEFMRQHHRYMGFTLHRNSNITLEAGGDGARGRVYVDALLMSSKGTLGMRAVGWYDDEYARVAGSWKLRKRKFQLVLNEGPWMSSPTFGPGPDGD